MKLTEGSIIGEQQQEETTVGTTTFRPQDQCTCPTLPCPRHSPDEQLGVYPKYRVEKLNGKPVGECFVLEARDPHAIAALRAYATSCAGQFGALADDLELMADRWYDDQLGDAAAL